MVNSALNDFSSFSNAAFYVARFLHEEHWVFVEDISLFIAAISETSFLNSETETAFYVGVSMNCFGTYTNYISSLAWTVGAAALIVSVTKGLAGALSYPKNVGVVVLTWLYFKPDPLFSCFE